MNLFSKLARVVLVAAAVSLSVVNVRAGSNTVPRPTVASASGQVTYVDSAGNAYPALVTKDFAASSASNSAGALNLLYVDPNASNITQASDFLIRGQGRKLVNVNNVSDQGVAGVTTTPNGSVSSGTNTFVVSSSTGIPASGYVTGVGIAQGSIANPAYNSLQPSIPTTINAGTAYTISNGTVTLASNTTSALTTSSSLFFAANPTAYWRYSTPVVTAVDTFTALPTAGDTLTISTPTVTQTYTFVASLTGSANQVLIGAALTNTLANLKAAINAASGSGTTYGTGTSANATVSCTAQAATTVSLSSTANLVFSQVSSNVSNVTFTYTVTD